jgi:hypothetical protein
MTTHWFEVTCTAADAEAAGQVSNRDTVATVARSKKTISKLEDLVVIWEMSDCIYRIKITPRESLAMAI